MDAKHGEYAPQEGTWTLTAPDGRQWHGASGLLVAATEQNERIPPEVQLARIFEGIDEAPSFDDYWRKVIDGIRADGLYTVEQVRELARLAYEAGLDA